MYLYFFHKRGSKMTKKMAKQWQKGITIVLKMKIPIKMGYRRRNHSVEGFHRLQGTPIPLVALHFPAPSQCLSRCDSQTKFCRLQHVPVDDGVVDGPWSYCYTGSGQQSDRDDNARYRTRHAWRRSKPEMKKRSKRHRTSKNKINLNILFWFFLRPLQLEITLPVQSTVPGQSLWILLKVQTLAMGPTAPANRLPSTSYRILCSQKVSRIFPGTFQNVGESNFSGNPADLPDWLRYL